MQSRQLLRLVGYASGIGGADQRVGQGPLVMQQSAFMQRLEQIDFFWDMISPSRVTHATTEEAVAALCQTLALNISGQVRAKEFFTVIGGDHSCAIGTWSGVYDALHEQGDFGLIWIDAHMDSHTPDTTLTGRIHGMPLACLLGHGYPALTTILQAKAKLKPEHVCLIGARSFESGEAQLLERLNIRVYFMEELHQRGLIPVLREAVTIVNQGTLGYGLSLDIDSIDPKEAPAVDVPEQDGLHASDLYAGLAELALDLRLFGVEIVEFDPAKDRAHCTEELVASFVNLFTKRVG
jgi:arginase